MLVALGERNKILLRKKLSRTQLPTPRTCQPHSSALRRVLEHTL